MTRLDHIILKVNDLEASVTFYTSIMGFQNAGTDGPFTIIRTSDEFQMQLAPWGTPGFEHYAFAVSRSDFDKIFARVKEAGLAYGPTFDSVGTNTGPGTESGARGEAPTVYFNDPSNHLIEIRTYTDD
jgi:catechol 2,3-dioxygenase-like lactoylglutathione lyase family enzyme